MAVAAVLQTQTEGDTAAWVQWEDGPLFPPDLAESGVDLSALVVVHVPSRAGGHGIPKAAEILLRSGGFGLVVLDLRLATPPGLWLSRFLGLARQHRSRVVLITSSGGRTIALGSVISLKIAPTRVRSGDGFVVQQKLVKDKLRGLRPGEFAYRGPWGIS